MTIPQIIAAITAAGKPVSQPQLYRYFNQLDIKPAGIRQRPQLYPADTADRIKRHLGLSAGQVQPNGVLAKRPAPPKLVTVAQLKAARPVRKRGAK